jgi:epoxyqueuosine reductase QueG
MNDMLQKELLSSGADVVGFADLKGFLDADISHLHMAVSIGVCKNLNEKTVQLLYTLQEKAARILKKEGCRYFCIPPDSDRIKSTFKSKLYPLFTHKIAATSAGMGWIGRNGLLISPEHGPRLSLATVLTDAPLKAGTPIEFCLCGDCRMCIDYCPSGAITGKDWSRERPFVEFVRSDDCRSHKKNTKTVRGKPNCGLCINICPYGRKNKNQSAKGRKPVRAEVP